MLETITVDSKKMKIIINNYTKSLNCLYNCPCSNLCHKNGLGEKTCEEYLMDWLTSKK